MDKNCIFFCPSMDKLYIFFIFAKSKQTSMDREEIQPLIESYHRRLGTVVSEYHRYLYSQINWEARMIGIRGARGVGKTTLLLQHIIENYSNVDDVLYASLDDLWFANHTVMELVDWVSLQGLKRLYLDEVHRCPDWAKILKNIYDSYPGVSIVYTSSSILMVDNGTADLSRRQTLYTLNGLSFREYLELEGKGHFDTIPLSELIENHVSIGLDLVRRQKIIPLFRQYLEHGYYPFYLDSGVDYFERLKWTINAVLENDLPAVENVTFETIGKVRRLLMLLGEKVPFVPNMSFLWRELSVNNAHGLRMLYALERAKILALATSEIKSYKQLSKPDKVFLDNTNLMYVLSSSVNLGGMRETFFFNQLSSTHSVAIPQHGDFLVDGKYLFEVGGKNKTFEQIANMKNSFIAADDMETGYSNKIPLWLFGFLY